MHNHASAQQHCVAVVVCDLGDLSVILDLADRTAYLAEALPPPLRFAALQDALAAAGHDCACGIALATAESAIMTG